MHHASSESNKFKRVSFGFSQVFWIHHWRGLHLHPPVPRVHDDSEKERETHVAQRGVPLESNRPGFAQLCGAIFGSLESRGVGGGIRLLTPRGDATEKSPWIATITLRAKVGSC